MGRHRLLAAGGCLCGRFRSGFQVSGEDSSPMKKAPTDAVSSIPASLTDSASSFAFCPAFDFKPDEPCERFESNRMGQCNDRQSLFQIRKEFFRG
jgi:hypothetical protein